MWGGFGLAVLLNVIFMVRSLAGGGGDNSIYWIADLSAVSAPWTAVHPLYGSIRPEVLGLGYLVSTDLLLTIWASYVLYKLQSVFLAAVGVGFSYGAYHHEQAIGGYLVLGAVLLMKDRTALVEAARSWLRPAEEKIAYLRWGLVAVVLGVVGCFLFMNAAGMAAWLAAAYLVIAVLVGAVYGRIRAETGIPLIWALPWGRQDKILYHLLGQETIIGPGPDLRSPTILALFQIVNMGHLQTVAGYQIEGLQMGRRVGLDWSKIATACLTAVAWGALGAFVFHLIAYYDVGVPTARGSGSFTFGMNSTASRLREVLSGAQAPASTAWPQTLAAGWGGLVVFAFTMARARWVNFPLHPIGYVIATGESDSWFNFLVLWIFKSAILRYRGGRTYQQLVPFFLGLVLGHFISAGLVWGLLATTLGGVFLQWTVIFG
jgi:hypothetical protein